MFLFSFQALRIALSCRFWGSPCQGSPEKSFIVQRLGFSSPRLPWGEQYHLAFCVFFTLWPLRSSSWHSFWYFLHCSLGGVICWAALVIFFPVTWGALLRPPVEVLHSTFPLRRASWSSFWSFCHCGTWGVIPWEVYSSDSCQYGTMLGPHEEMCPSVWHTLV